ncbi:VOC family protein [Salinispira pacifica]
MPNSIHGIQQIGLGATDAELTFTWLRSAFGVDIPVFDDVGEPVHMLRYTGGELHRRRAILAASILGGSAFEIWQFESRTPKLRAFQIEIGDTGILAARVKSTDPAAAADRLASSGVETAGELSQDPAGLPGFFLQDPWSNWYQVVASDDWFTRERSPRNRKWTGGVCGCIVGVSDIDRSVSFYRDLLGYDVQVYDETGVFHDLALLPGGTRRVRRVRLSRSSTPGGPFGRWLGESSIELIQAFDHEPRHALEGRFWGDPGFIHLCFDVHAMDELKESFERAGSGFTVDSAESFDMGEASGRFAYTEDPDGTLIEFVEADRIPILKRMGIYLNVGRRDPEKPLPGWMIRLLGFGRVRD